MKNKTKLFGIIAFVVIIIFGMAACGSDGDSGSGSGSGSDEMTFDDVLAMLTPGDPPSAHLTNLGIDPTAWAAIKAAAGGTYKGYITDGDMEDDIDVFFTGATKANYDALKALAQAKGMEAKTPEQTDNTLWYIEYVDPATSPTKGFELTYSAGGSNPEFFGEMFIPAGVIYISFDYDE